MKDMPELTRALKFPLYSTRPRISHPLNHSHPSSEDKPTLFGQAP